MALSSLRIKSKILEKQMEYLTQQAIVKLGKDATQDQISAYVGATIQQFYKELGKPLFQKRMVEEGHFPFFEEYNENTKEAVTDVGILFGEIEEMGTFASDYFNYAQTEKQRVSDQVRGLTNVANDLQLLAKETSENSVYFKDSFNDKKQIEEGMNMGTSAHISTSEGIVTLARAASMNRSIKAKIRSIDGNGEFGTQHIARRTINMKGETVYTYVSEQIPNNLPEAVLDGRPDSIFEYQMVNTDKSNVTGEPKGYDFEWINGKKHGDTLRMRMVIELEKPEDVNWISIDPYHPVFSTGKVVVYSIRTSEDGFDYRGIYEDGEYVLNTSLNTTAQSYREDELFTGDNRFETSKFAGQGVWVFASRKIKYVEVVFDQHESYEELIGHTYYEEIRKSRNAMGQAIEKRTRVPSSEVPARLLQADVGEHSLVSDVKIKKAVEAFPGWRYAIGIRDINVMSYEFVNKSEFFSKRFTVDTPIEKIMLYANEKIPPSFTETVSNSQDWIQYFISVDDVNWHPISPMHHQPLKKDFPPKIYEINGKQRILDNEYSLYKGIIESNKEPLGVRLKVVLSRPIPDPKDREDEDKYRFYTPVLEDYALRIVLQEEV